jgi:hypothetical protein
MGYTPQQRPWTVGNGTNWQGQVDAFGDLPNSAGSAYQYGVPNVQHGDLAWVTTGFTGLYLCIDPTPGAAIWIPVSGGPAPLGSIAPEYEWNLNGVLAFITPQPGTFGGMLASNPALSGPGPFDGTRLVRRPGTLALGGFTLRVPAAFPGGPTFVEFYRMRAGVVASLGVMGLGTVAPTTFSGVSSAPAPTDLATGDLLFVALAGVAPVGAADLSAFLQVTP